MKVGRLPHDPAQFDVFLECCPLAFFVLHTSTVSWSHMHDLANPRAAIFTFSTALLLKASKVFFRSSIIGFRTVAQWQHEC